MRPPSKGRGWGLPPATAAPDTCMPAAGLATSAAVQPSFLLCPVLHKHNCSQRIPSRTDNQQGGFPEPHEAATARAVGSAWEGKGHQACTQRAAPCSDAVCIHKNQIYENYMGNIHG